MLGDLIKHIKMIKQYTRLYIRTCVCDTGQFFKNIFHYSLQGMCVFGTLQLDFFQLPLYGLSPISAEDYQSELLKCSTLWFF